MDLQQKLWIAALDGQNDEAKELIAKGANVNAATDLFKATALHRASLMGKTVAVDVLLKIGANINQKDGDGLTALHMAVTNGHRVIMQYLLRAGAFVDAQNRDGRTPLHVAAINGDFKSIQFLLSEKATIEALDKDGHTALDLARKKIIQKKDEGLTAEAEPLYRAVALLESYHKKAVEKLEKPSLLQNFGEEAESRFHEYLQQGSEDYYEINLMFIGQAGVGKTTLTKGLLGELDPHVPPASTNGIDLHLHRCKYDRHTRHIYPVSEENTDHSLNQRIGSLIQMSLKDTPIQCSARVPEDSVENPSNNTCVLEHTQSNREGKTEKENIQYSCEEDINEVAAATVSYTTTYPQSLNPASLQRNSSETNAASSHTSPEYTLESLTCTVVTDDMTETSPTLSMSSVGNPMSDPNGSDSLFTSSTQVKSLVNRAKLSSSEEKPERLVPITIWDFGGQEVFYTTHQTFLSSCCIYMMAFNLFEFWQESDPMKASNAALDTISFWINSVITYAKHAVTGYPKIVLIGTHADYFPVELRGSSLWKIFQRLEKHFRQSVQRQHLIISPRYFIDAKDAEGVPFDLLRQCVMEVAESLPDWGLPIPHKWVVLENLIADLKSSGSKVVSVDKLKSLLSNEFNFNRQEIEDFLSFQHSYSKILYFKESHLLENIILDPCWVIDALSAFITYEGTTIFPTKTKTTEWENLRVNGKLSKGLIEEVWGHSKFYPVKDYLLNVLCRLDMITQSKNENLFYVPGMVKEKCPTQIINDIHSATEIGLVSFKISFKNKFLPPAIYNRLVAAFISMFENSSPFSSQLFNDCAIFELTLSRWTILCKEGHEILVFTYISDRRGKAANLKAFGHVYSITIDCLKDLLKIYCAFQNPSLRQNDLPFEVHCQGCRSPRCYISKKEFHKLGLYQCPHHGDHLCSVETLEEIFRTKEVEADRGHNTSAVNLPSDEIMAINENKECFLDYIASRFPGNDYVFLAAALGFGLHLVEKQRHEFASQHELVFSILLNWEKAHSFPQSNNLLLQALENTERNEMVEEIKHFSFKKYLNDACLLDIPDSEKQISDKDLVIVSRNVKYFKRLLRFLKVPQEKIFRWENDFKEEPTDYVAFISLSRWKSSGSNSTRLHLCAALLYLDLTDLVDRLIKQWKS